ncbi:CHAT domain-containing protein [Streptomyces sp. NPDC051677]|uniref:CHAT domain-containing WD40 repeat protein n=1 Tax=Streptomyces sp. NPDC051677 TaxID=3365669 RepID=UPI0037D17E2B
MEGLPFRVEIIETDTEWIVQCSSEFGEASMRVPPPCSKSELQSALYRVEKSLAKSYSMNIVRGASAPEKSVREFGNLLARTILRDKIFTQFDRCRTRAEEQGKSLRVLLRTDGPQVVRIPWEYMIDPAYDDYLALHVPVVRDLRLMNPITPAPLDLPLRVLGISALPTDLPPLEAQQEREQIAQILRQDSSEKVDFHWLSGDRWQDLRRALETGTWHVLHCVCHGGFDEVGAEGYIQLSGDDGSAMRLHARDFRRLVHSTSQLRLVMLNACESAVSGPENAFTSTAAALVTAGVPAVVAMQYEITDRAAFTFASSFYERIAEGVPVDRAVTSARDDVKVRLGTLEWATPVLFLASDTAQIFAPKVSLVRGKQQTGPSSTPGPLRQPPEGTAVLADVGRCGHVALGPGNLVAAACEDGVIRVIEGAKGELVAHCSPVQREKPVRLAWSPWRRHIASRHQDGTVVIWDLKTETPVRVMTAEGQGDSLAFSSDGHWLALTAGHHLHVYDAYGGRVRDLAVCSRKEAALWAAGQNAPLGPVSFAPGDRHIVVACGDGRIRQLNVRGQPVMQWPHPQPVVSLAVTDGLLATGCLDGRVRLWTWEGDLLWRTRPGRPAYQLAFAAEGPAVAMAHQRGKVTVRNVHTGTASPVVKLANRPVGLAFLEDDEGLVTATRMGKVERWELPDWMVE